MITLIITLIVAKLAQLVLDLLDIPAMAAEDERVFSSTGKRTFTEAAASALSTMVTSGTRAVQPTFDRNADWERAMAIHAGLTGLLCNLSALVRKCCLWIADAWLLIEA
jgi:hypothetical protein